MKNLMIFFVVALFFVSTNAISADYSQTQNKVDDKMNAPKDPHSHDKKSDSHKHSDKSTSATSDQNSSSNSGVNDKQGSESGGNTTSGNNPSK